MASSILNQIYKEAATTSKGVVQMNRTLNKIYDDQQTGNKRQEKFLADLKARQRREDREEKKRQSDLKKLIAGTTAASRGKDNDDDGGLNLDGGGLLAAITGGLATAFNFLKDTLIGAILRKLRNFFRFPRNPFRGNRGGNRGGRGGGRGNNRGGNRGGNKGNNSGGNKGNARPGGNNQPPKKPGDVVKPGGNRPQPGGNRAPNVGKPGGPQPLQPTKPTATPPKNTGGFRGFLNRLRKFVFRNPTKGVKFKGISLRGLGRGGLTSLVMILADIFMPEIQDAVATLYSRLGIKSIKDISDEKLIYQYLSEQHTFAQLNKNQPFKDLMGDQFGGGPSDRRATLQRELERREIEIPEYDGTEPVEPKKLQRGGGVFDVPGHGQGDQVPMMLPPGAFVLNRVASQEMFARGGSPSGMVPTLLEPGEKVFMPGDPLMDMAMNFNSAFSRFQKGGMVHPELSRMSDDNIKLRNSAYGMCVKGSLNTMAASGVPNPDATGRDKGNNPRGAIVQMIKDFGWKSMGGTPTELNSPYGDVNTGVYSRAEYDGLVDTGKVPSGALVFQTRHDTWNGTSPGSKGYDMAIAQQGGAKLWNGGMGAGTMIDKYVYGDTKKVVVLTPDGKQGDGSDSQMNSEPSPTQKDSSNSGGGLLGGIGKLLSPMTDIFGKIFGPDGPMGEVMSTIGKEMQGLMGDVMKEIEGEGGLGGLSGNLTEEMNKVMETITSEMNAGSKVSPSPQPSSQHMKVIKDAMNPEEKESPTIVQVIPTEDKSQDAYVAGAANQNLPPALTTRCSSWASADYRFDRSLNTET